MYSRALADIIARSKKSILLLGPRQTGKSTLLASLRPELTINLAHEPTFLAFLSDPAELEMRIAAAKPKSVLLDEVQRIPSLLNSVQALLDAGGPRFLLSGSSARKLRRGQANLLPGRVHAFSIGGLVSLELGYALDTSRALSTGTLPGLYADGDDASVRKTLSSYVSTYLREEVQAEALTRNLEGFARFLSVAAACSGSFLDVSKLGREAQITRASALRYFEILEDTLVVERCDAFSSSARRRLIQHPRYFFFDVGVLNALQRNFTASQDRIGMLFEHLIFTQLRHSAFARDIDLRVSTFRTEHGAEVDFIVERDDTLWAIECKASKQVGPSDLRGFASLSSVTKRKPRCIVAYLGDVPKRMGQVDVLPWQQMLREIGL
jgi:predicted AAA+ superfamily ATPase